MKGLVIIDSLHATGLFQYPLKTSENQKFYSVFMEYMKRQVAWNGLINENVVIIE